MKKLKATLCLMAVLLVFGFAGQAHAAGIYLGTGPGMSFPNFEGDLGDLNADGGFSWEYLHVGYAFSDQWSVNVLWGQAAGPAEDVDWTTDYLDLGLRYTFPTENFRPYLEGGLGSYQFKADGDGFDVEADPVLGYRVAVGGLIPLSQFYVAPEFSYHFADYDEGEVHVSGLGTYSVDDIGSGSFGLLSLKIGYMFGTW